ncbi:hypothetical protein [Pseudofulvibacter geojedonensis]|uniref:Tetratricopeptide repeat protein n=1 Tax=Pseudofulvibacter geojedonensis TaxID=1123758 RepID=A0ABW3I097_9FLAO
MALQIADKYYLKAKDSVCYDWEEACDSLNYAISYDEAHCPSLTLLGIIYAKYLHNLEEAFMYFDKVIETDSNYIEVYPEYIKALIWADELERAQKIIDFSLKIKAIDKAMVLWNQAIIYEIKEAYKDGIKSIKEAKKFTYNDGYRSFLNNEKTRLKNKIEEASPKKKKKSKKKKKKEAKTSKTDSKKSKK